MDLNKLLKAEFVGDSDILRKLSCTLCGDVLFDQPSETQEELEPYAARLLGHFASHNIDVRVEECSDPECEFNGGDQKCKTQK